MIIRDDYLAQLLEYRDNGFIKVLTGVRRCGKSFILKSYQEALEKSGVPTNNIIFMNFEELSSLEIDNQKALLGYLKSQVKKDEKYYLLLDEIQNISGWEKVVNAYRLEPNVDVVITGSNAFLLSSELATLLSGRYIQLAIYPLSFREFLKFKEVDEPNDLVFNEYVQYGGFPSIVLSRTDSLKTDFLTTLYDSILLKDIAARKSITDVTDLENIVRYLFDVIGNPISIKKVVDTIKSGGGQTSHETVTKYLRSLEEAFIFYNVERFDVKGKNLLKTENKYYCVDTGLRNLVAPPTSKNFGFLLQNIVFLELKRRKYVVHIGKIGVKEIDFVCTKGNDICYIQLTQSLIDESTREREFLSLRMVKDNYKKFVISLDRLNYSSEGIKHLNLIEFLIDPNSLE